MNKIITSRLTCLAAGLLLCLFNYSQQYGLKTGDKVPEMDLVPIINYTVESQKISDFKNKLLILDFWATWCKPCIDNFPKIDSLQEHFGNKILILPVTYQDQTEVMDFLTRYYKKKKIKVPSLTNATEKLMKVFPHTIIPHCVWIYNGKVKAITEARDVTQENIRRLLNGKNLNARTKIDGIKRIDREKTMFNIGYNARYILNDSSVKLPMDSNRISYYSILTNDYTENESGFGYPMGLTGNGITVGNCIFQKLFLWAFSEMQAKFIFEDRLVVEISDSARYDSNGRIGLDAIDWMNQGHSYSYELKVPPQLFDNRFKIMQNDLNNYFGNVLGIEGGIEKRKRWCLVLKSIDSSIIYKTKGGTPENKKTAYQIVLKNMNISWLIEYLRQHRFNYTKEHFYSIENDINDQIKIDVDISGDFSDLQEVNRELLKYGLNFFPEERIIDVVVIKDKK